MVMEPHKFFTTKCQTNFPDCSDNETCCNVCLLLTFPLSLHIIDDCSLTICRYPIGSVAVMRVTMQNHCPCYTPCISLVLLQPLVAAYF